MPGLLKKDKIEDISQKELIRSPIQTVFQAMTTARLIDEWGGGPARVQARVNGRYSLWDGDMWGIIKEIEFPRRIVFTWREASWDASLPDSTVTWSLKETERGTELHLVHTNLPSRKIRESHNDGWGEYFVGPLKAWLEKAR
jgi:uncharacterized protein YndB with AHSA1/START domain